MTHHHIKTLWIYWALLAAGTFLSSGIFTARVQNWDANLWLAVWFGLAMTGLRMASLGSRDLRDNHDFKASRHVLLGIVTGFPFLVFIYFSVSLLGYYVFYLDYACWTLFSLSTIYYAIRIWRISSRLRSGVLKEQSAEL